MLKKGDKLLCKKVLVDCDDSNDHFEFIMYKKYKIKSIKHNNEVKIKYKDTYYYFYMRFSDANSGIINHRLNDYFYTEKEIRKLKLKELDEI